MNRMIFPVFFVFLVSCAFADEGVSAALAGHYKSYTTTAVITDLGQTSEGPRLKIHTELTLGECVGKITGEGVLKDRILAITLPSSSAKRLELGCHLTIEFLDNQRIRINESGCSDYHGAYCGWLGQTLKRVVDDA